MKYIIKLEDGRFIKQSVSMEPGRKPTFTTEQLEAEVWIDQKAAVAFCEEKGFGAEIFPIDIPVAEMVPAKPKAAKVTKAE